MAALVQQQQHALMQAQLQVQQYQLQAQAANLQVASYQQGATLPGPRGTHMLLHALQHPRLCCPAVLI